MAVWAMKAIGMRRIQLDIRGEQEKLLYWDFLTSCSLAWVIYCVYDPQKQIIDRCADTILE
jgi:hypothetical protein